MLRTGGDGPPGAQSPSLRRSPTSAPVSPLPSRSGWVRCVSGGRGGLWPPQPPLFLTCVAPYLWSFPFNTCLPPQLTLFLLPGVLSIIFFFSVLVTVATLAHSLSSFFGVWKLLICSRKGKEEKREKLIITCSTFLFCYFTFCAKRREKVFESKK